MRGQVFPCNGIYDCDGSDGGFLERDFLVGFRDHIKFPEEGFVHLYEAWQYEMTQEAAIDRWKVA